MCLLPCPSELSVGRIQPQLNLRSRGAMMRGIIAAGRMRKELSVGEVAARSGVAVSAIHFYEAKGLIRRRRNHGNQRRYKREVLRLVAVIKVAQRIGMPLAVIRDALATLPHGRTPTAADWK